MKICIIYVLIWFRCSNMLTTRQIFAQNAKDIFSGFIIIDGWKIRSFIYNMYYDNI